MKCALENKQVANRPQPSVRFLDFGDSALMFELLFYSSNMFRIERVKSDIRFAVDSKFRENGILIPFPQRDLHIKTEPATEKDMYKDLTSEKASDQNPSGKKE